jgi:hypothetical protein
MFLQNFGVSFRDNTGHNPEGHSLNTTVLKARKLMGHNGYFVTAQVSEPHQSALKCGGEGGERGGGSSGRGYCFCFVMYIVSQLDLVLGSMVLCVAFINYVRSSFQISWRMQKFGILINRVFDRPFKTLMCFSYRFFCLWFCSDR